MRPLAIAVIALVVLFFLALSWASWRGFRTIHRRGHRWFAAASIIGNLFWLALPLFAVDRLTPAMRWVRAILAPPWFFWLMFTLLYSSVLSLALLLWASTVRREGVSFGRFGRPFSILYLSTMAVIAVVGFVTALVPLRVERVAVTVPNLPPALEGTKIALISDLHVGLFSRPSRLAQISRTIDSLQPDRVVICGDLIDDDPYFVPKFLTGLAPIRASIPITAVLGNHEMYGKPREVIDRLRGSRVQLLVNEGTGVLKGDAILWFAGISDYAGADGLKPDLNAALRGRPDGAMTILLAHQPKAYPAAIANDIPLVLVGHSHGGQFGFRWLNWTLAGVFLPEHMGLYHKKNTQMFVTTGAGYWLVPIRFGLAPEVILIELKR